MEDSNINESISNQSDKSNYLNDNKRLLNLVSHDKNNNEDNFIIEKDKSLNFSSNIKDKDKTKINGSNKKNTNTNSLKKIKSGIIQIQSKVSLFESAGISVSLKNSNYKDISHDHHEHMEDQSEDLNLKKFENSLKSLEKVNNVGILKYDNIRKDKLIELYNEISYIKERYNSINKESKISFVQKSHNKEITAKPNFALSLLEKTIPIYKKILFYDQENVNILNELCDVYLQLNDLNSALTCIKQAYEYDTNNISIKQKLEKIHLAKGIIMLKKDGVSKDNLNKLMKNKNQENSQENAFLTGISNIIEPNSNNNLKNLNIFFKVFAYININKFDDAIRELNEILNANEKNIEALILASKICLHQGKEQESNFYFWKLYEIDPNHNEVTPFIKVMKNKMNNCINEARINMAKGRIECSFLWMNKALTFYPNNPECLLIRSKMFKQINNINQSIKDIDEARKAIENELLIKEKLIANQNIKNTIESSFISEDSLTKHKLFKEISDTYNELALTLLTNEINNNKKLSLESLSIKGDNRIISESLRLLKESLKYTPMNKNIYINIGDIHFYLKDYNKSYYYYSKAYKIDFKDSEIKARISGILYKYAMISFNTKNYSESIEFLQKAIELSPYCCEFLYLEAKCWIKLNNSNLARTLLLKSLEINPNHNNSILLMNHLSYKLSL